jgi:hypothetical protein
MSANVSAAFERPLWFSYAAAADAAAEGYDLRMHGRRRNEASARFDDVPFFLE